MSQPRIVTSAKLLKYANIRFGMSTRLGGVSPEPFGLNLSFRVGDDPANVLENRRRLFSSLGFESHDVAVPLQCHSNNVQVAGKPGEYESCDGLITNTAGLPLVVTVADCVPIVLFEPRAAVLGLAHAGWRGAAQGIVAEAVALMVKEFSLAVSELVAYLGPSAGVCCYEVGSDVAEAFSLDLIEQRGDKLFLDLKRANVEQLLGCGLKRDNIEVADACTICSPQLFHSHRRDRNRSGRMMAVASIVDLTKG